MRVPDVRIDIVENGFGGNVAGKGHGLQRGVILGTMRLEVEELAAERGDGQQHLILLIEEPELYQHPTRARFFARTLQAIAELEGVCLVYATHSPYFLSLASFPAIRLIRHQRRDGMPSRRVSAATLHEIASELGVAYNSDSYTAQSLSARIHGSLDASLREGFFADRVILCEGDEDVAFLSGAFEMYGIDAERLDVALISANGKTNLDKAFCIFRKLSIPVFILFDCDWRGRTLADLQAARDVNEQGIADKVKAYNESAKFNRAMFRLLGAQEQDFPEIDIIHGAFAAWRKNFRSAVVDGFDPAAQFDSEFARIAQEQSYVPKQAKKVPAVIRATLDSLSKRGFESQTLVDLAQRIRAFVN